MSVPDRRGEKAAHRKRSARAGRNAEMDCKEFIRLIPNWLDGKLDGKRGAKFLDHMNTCKDCREELHIQFLVREGTARLESGGSFNLDKELSEKVTAYKKKLKRKHTENVIIYWMEAIAGAAIIFILILVFILM